ncbi:hypothetical protein O4H53_00345 [Sulfitobacter sp. G21635-S1]|uniref:hypothetical protein n=1 Tax=Sulfitobacter sp. G21635-S1 TaxID=3014043 RepID=UPI0022AEEFD8|nr:hypothetical protein [Sulfitobacter sp. G21635-S1]MCZ4253964.1 hypothetical protein [Sulfitobacter sp. G21635-S1]
MATFTFLRLNGVPLSPDPGIGIRMMEELMSCQVSEDAIAVWLRDLAARADTG